MTMTCGQKRICQTLRCDGCGQFVKWVSTKKKRTHHIMIQPDTPFGPEIWETYCPSCYKKYYPIKEIR